MRLAGLLLETTVLLTDVAVAAGGVFRGGRSAWRCSAAGCSTTWSTSRELASRLGAATRTVLDLAFLLLGLGLLVVSSAMSLGLAREPHQRGRPRSGSRRGRRRPIFAPRPRENGAEGPVAGPSTLTYPGRASPHPR